MTAPLRISWPVLFRTYLVILSGQFLKFLTQITYSVFHYTPDKIICDSSAKIKKETMNIYTITSFFLKNMYDWKKISKVITVSIYIKKALQF